MQLSQRPFSGSFATAELAAWKSINSDSYRPFTAIRKGSIDSHPKAPFNRSQKAARRTRFQNRARRIGYRPKTREYGRATASPADGH
jgi:hypothetical protein